MSADFDAEERLIRGQWEFAERLAGHYMKKRKMHKGDYLWGKLDEVDIRSDIFFALSNAARDYLKEERVHTDKTEEEAFRAYFVTAARHQIYKSLVALGKEVNKTGRKAREMMVEGPDVPEVEDEVVARLIEEDINEELEKRMQDDLILRAKLSDIKLTITRDKTLQQAADDNDTSMSKIRTDQKRLINIFSENRKLKELIEARFYD